MITSEATTAAEDVAVNVGCAPCANLSGFASHGLFVGTNSARNIHYHIVFDMAIFASTKHRAINPAALNVDMGVLHVGPSIEVRIGNALATAKDIAGDGMGSYFCQGARHAQRATSHDNRGGIAKHIGGFAATIEAGEDVTATDFHAGVAPHLSCRAQPLAMAAFVNAIRIITRSTAKHVAIEGGAVLAGFWFMGLRVKDVDVIRGVIPTKCPTGTFGQGLMLGIVPFFRGIRTIRLGSFIENLIASTDLSTFDCHISAVKHVAVVGTAVHGAKHEGIVLDSYLCGAHRGHQFNKAIAFYINDRGIGELFHPSFAAAKHVAPVVGIARIGNHLHIVHADGATAHGDLGMASSGCNSDVAHVSAALVPCEVAHIAHLATAIHTAVDACRA